MFKNAVSVNVSIGDEDNIRLAESYEDVEYPHVYVDVEKWGSSCVFVINDVQAGLALANAIVEASMRAFRNEMKRKERANEADLSVRLKAVEGSGTD